MSADLPSRQDGWAPVAHRDLSYLASMPEFETGLMIAMPCCAFMMGADMEDTVPGEWSMVYEPPRWTCPQCD
jgi:hypothetical protein